MSQFSSKSTKEVVSQLIFPRADVDKFYESQSYKDELYRLTEMGVGGFCIFGGNLEKLNVMTGQLQSRSEIPLIITADFEYGLPMRLEDGTEFPHAMALGRTSPDRTYEIAAAIAKESAAAGVNWVLAPVCDINNNPKNPVINIRSFGEQAEVVENHAVSFIKGLQDNKIAACAKHFPGHGDTDIDSHLDLPSIQNTLESLDNNEIRPFVKAIKSKVKSIMTAHLNVPAMDVEPQPVSLSNKVVDGYLSNMLKYDGIKITDALDMKSVTKMFSSGRATELAFRAGNDIALMPENPNESIEQMIILSDRDNKLKNKLVSSADKLYDLKRWCGLIPQFAKPDNNPKIFMHHQKIALKAAYEAIKVDDSGKMLPIKDDSPFVGYAILQKPEDMRPATRFFTMLAQATEANCDFAYIDDSITDENISEFLSKTTIAKYIIFPIFIKSRAYHGSVNLSEKITKIIEKLANGRPKIIILMGSPYLIENLPNDCNILTYSDSFPSLASAVMKLTDRKFPDI